MKLYIQENLKMELYIQENLYITDTQGTEDICPL